jgi:hypothetical protein
MSNEQLATVMAVQHQARRSGLALVTTVGVAMLLVLASACTSDADDASSGTATAVTATAVTAPQLADPVATATELVTAWLETLKSGESVADLMAPNFEIQRADGSGANRNEYLANQAAVDDYTLSDTVIASQSGNTLSVRWSLQVSEEINGVQYDDVDAPRLTVFEWTGEAWQIVGYANFTPSR